MTRRDEAYKNIFMHREIIINLLQGFVNHGWVKYINWDSLVMIPTEHISDKLDRRANDCVWKVK
ncbi:MAG: transposase, partial [Deltaproteobacteria bacterium]|nr:transposase [Deltaproteobacteria bacterium]